MEKFLKCIYMKNKKKLNKIIPHCYTFQILDRLDYRMSYR